MNPLPPAVWSAASGWVAVAASVAATAAAAAHAIAAGAAEATAATVATHTHAAAILRALSTAMSTDILHGRSTASATTGATTAATTARSESTSAFASDALQEARNFLVGLLEKINQVTNNTAVATVEERSRDTGVSGTASTANTMHIVVNVGRQIVIEDMLNIGYVQTYLCY